MTLKDLIEVLVHYSVEHILLPPPEIYHKDATEIAGYCDHDLSSIVIDTEMSIMDQRLTVIHECVHAWMHISGVRDTEEAVEVVVNKLFRELYPEYDEATHKKKKAGK